MASLVGDKVFVCGGGHQGLSMAAHLALCGVDVTLWNRTADNIKEIIDSNMIFTNGVVRGIGKISKASDDIQEVFFDFVMVTTPSSGHKDVAIKLAPFVNRDTVIVLNPGRTFGAIEFAETLKLYGVKELPHIAETQTIVYTCRKSAADKVTIYSLKNDVYIAALHNEDLEYIMKRMPRCLEPYFKAVDSVAITSFSNVGMVLHCAPVLMNVGWIETKTTDFKYYYDGISESVANLLEKIDKERLGISAQLGYNIESVADWIRRTYSLEGEDLFECIQNNVAYREIDAPQMIKSRYIMEDVPNGLVPMEHLARSIGMETPVISNVINLANTLLDIDFRCIGRRFDWNLVSKYL